MSRRTTVVATRSTTSRGASGVNANSQMMRFARACSGLMRCPTHAPARSTRSQAARSSARTHTGRLEAGSPGK